MLHIKKDRSYTVEPQELPETISPKRFKNISRQMGLHDPTAPTYAEFNGLIVEPFAPLEDGPGALIVIHEGITYHANIT